MFLSDDFLASRIRDHLLRALGRDPGATVGVREIALELALELGCPWQDVMRPLRTITASLADERLIDALQNETVVDIRDVRGPVALRLRAIGR